MGENDEDKLGNRRENRDGAEKMCHDKRADWLWEMRKRLVITWVSEQGTGNMGVAFTEIRTTTGDTMILVFRLLN